MEKTRNTKQKQLILDLLSGKTVPLTVTQLYECATERCPSIAKSTVYRNLESMAKRGEVERGFLESGEAFYYPVGQKHRHYMICRDCRKMQDLPSCPMEQLEGELSALPDFVPTDHIIQVYGYCKECADRHK